MISTLLTIFMSSFVIALSGALMPGPLLTVTVTESSRRGMFAGPLLIVGHGILELLLILALLSGLAPLLLRNDIFVAISLIGGAVLLWIAITMLKDIPNLRLEIAHEVENKRNLVFAGIILSVANPYFIIWWASVGLGYIVYATKFGTAGIVAFFTGHILADLGWYFCVSYGVVKGKHLLSDQSYRRLIGGCALFLVVFSGYFFYSGIEKII